MNRKTKMSGGAAALALLAIISASHIGQEPAPPLQTRPVSPVTQADKGLTPSKPKTAPVSEESANVEPRSTPPTEIDFEPPNADTLKRLRNKCVKDVKNTIGNIRYDKGIGELPKCDTFCIAI